MPKKNDIAGSCIKLHNEELLDVYSSPHVYSGDEIKEGETDGGCDIHGAGDRCRYFWLGGNQEERGHFANLSVEGTIRWSLKK